MHHVDSVVLLDTGTPMLAEPIFPLLIEDQPQFVQDLFARWQQLAWRNTDSMDSFLEVTT